MQNGGRISRTRKRFAGRVAGRMDRGRRDETAGCRMCRRRAEKRQGPARRDET